MRIYPDPEKLAESDYTKEMRRRQAIIMLLMKTIIQSSQEKENGEPQTMEETTI
ncbi:MAG: hypothetical protein ACW99F_03775 [Candidatus Hodarchaeales archaeon]|jgi:hypothetical protein